MYYDCAHPRVPLGTKDAIRPGMHRNVEMLIGRLATDPRLQSRFAEQPFEVLHEQRLELTEVEIEALAAIDPAAIRAFTAALDTRLRKASLAVDRLASGTTSSTEPERDSEKETQR
jgi:hypothetical protein